MWLKDNVANFLKTRRQKVTGIEGPTSLQQPAEVAQATLVALFSAWCLCLASPAEGIKNHDSKISL